MGEILKIIDSLPYIFEYIIPGIVFMLVYRRLAPSGKRVADTIFYLSSVVISVVTEAVVKLILTASASENDQRIVLLLSCVICMVMAVVLSVVKGDNRFSSFMGRYFIKAPNDNIWASLIDFQNGSYLYLYLKNGGLVEGYLREIEENGNDSWVALQKYKYERNGVCDAVQELIKERPDYLAFALIRVADIEHAVIVNKQ